MITPEILKHFGNHIVKVAFGTDYYDIDQKGNMTYNILQTYREKGFKKNVKDGPDIYGRYTYSKSIPIERGTEKYKAGINSLKQNRYGRSQLRRAGIIKRKKFLGIF
ncbi:MAG: hypothetical protein DRP09_10355 [Candidatus Thorarchaeota archaeon]|nr:MAG: hypothetical protein DRP09_10355 [Candidatus Thorarchaeota archaeon]